MKLQGLTNAVMNVDYFNESNFNQLSNNHLRFIIMEMCNMIHVGSLRTTSYTKREGAYRALVFASPDW